ncbi:hypothetical protein J2S74_000049 [Evansella vedderi]|uniref:Uncharacterized protein n=1 Tax=Evansella vedderi TaxID=38282 RepID=A0ABT9ZN71_9BACI|nr:hypothetical protein [Evansella vedderi]
MNQASEHHIGTDLGDGVTGAPVIELGYKCPLFDTVPEEADMVTY